MLQQYQQFYRDTGVRRFSELMNPRLQLFKGFPRNSLLHHLTFGEELFPDPSKLYFKGYTQRLPLELVYHSDQMSEHARAVPFIPQKYVLPFLKDHREFRYVPDIVQYKVDERTLGVLDYNALKLAYRFPSTAISELERWESFNKTFWANISRLAMSTNKNQFVLMDPIVEIPSLTLLNSFSSKEGLSLFRLFHTPERLFVLHLYRWLNPEFHQNSVFHQIELKALNRINIVFLLKDGRCSTLNLAYLYSWIKANENLTTIKEFVQYDYPMVIKAILKYFLVISSNIPEDAVETPIEQTQQEHQEEREILDDLQENSDTTEFLSFHRPSSQVPMNEEPLGINKIQEQDHFEVSKLNDELEILEIQNHNQLSNRGIKVDRKAKSVSTIEPELKQYSHEDVHLEVHASLHPNDALRQKIEHSFKTGNLNAASYKKALEEANKYSKMKDPYGTNVPVLERTKINPQALKIDPSMLFS